MDGYSFAQLAKSLLGSGQYNANRPELPAEVDYVAYCLRRKHSGGRLDGLAICSGIVAPGHDIPSLALLPQSLVWAVKETNGVLCIEEKGGDAK